MGSPSSRISGCVPRRGPPICCCISTRWGTAVIARRRRVPLPRHTLLIDVEQLVGAATSNPSSSPVG
jgi:hypothetical protein